MSEVDVRFTPPAERYRHIETRVTVVRDGHVLIPAAQVYLDDEAHVDAFVATVHEKCDGDGPKNLKQRPLDLLLPPAPPEREDLGEEAEDQEPEDSMPWHGQPRATFDMSGGDLGLVVRQAYEALRKSNVDPTIFLHGGRLVAIDRKRDEEEENPELGHALLTLRQLDAAAMMDEMSRRTRPYRVDAQGNVTFCYPTQRLITTMMVRPWPYIPRLVGHTEVPIFTKKGMLLDKPGYDRASGLFYEPAPGLYIPPVPERPTNEDMTRARELFTVHVLGDFSFVSPADLANCVALALEQFLRKMIAGFLPLHDFQAPGKASGKSLTAELMILPFAGRSYPRRVFPENEEERAKTALSFLKKGRPFLWFENKSGFIESDVLDVLLTTPVFSGRELGHSVDLVIPVRCSFVMTSNNPSFEEQVSRRRVRTRLDTGLEQPQLRDPSQFRYPDIVGWAEANRGELIWACLTLIRSWVAASKPRSKRKPFGTFQQWADTMGSLLDYVRIPGLIDNMEEALRLDDVLGDVWRRFVGEWARIYPQHPVVTTKELHPIAQAIEDFPWGKAQDERQQKAALTRQLRAKKDRPVGGYKITIVTNDKGKELTTGGHVHFRLVPLDPPNGPQERELKSGDDGNNAKELEVVGGSGSFSDDSSPA